MYNDAVHVVLIKIQVSSTINLVKIMVKLICKMKKEKIDINGGMIELPNSQTTK